MTYPYPKYFRRRVNAEEEHIARSYEGFQHVVCERCGTYAPGSTIDTIAGRAWCYDCQSVEMNRRRRKPMINKDELCQELNDICEEGGEGYEAILTMLRYKQERETFYLFLRTLSGGATFYPETSGETPNALLGFACE